MKKSTRYLFAVAAVLVMLALAGCGGGFDPVAFVQGGLDASIHGNVSQEFIDSVDDMDSVEECEAEYDEMLDYVTEVTLSSAGYDEIPADLQANVKTMFANMMKNTKYEVSDEYTEDGDGFIVQVTAYPLLSCNKVWNDEDGAIEDAASAKIDYSMSMDEMMTVFLNETINAMNTALENPEYGEPQVLDVHILLTDEGYYEINEDDITVLTETLLGE